MGPAVTSTLPSSSSLNVAVATTAAPAQATGTTPLQAGRGWALPLWPRREQLTLAAWPRAGAGPTALPRASHCKRPCPQPTVPYAGALAAASRPFAGGLDHSRSPLQEAWPWLAAHPPPHCVCYENTTRTRRSYITVFQIRMEKMKEVKRPPL
ncbi:hypothetical protein BHE74_00003734 [Ensete ventricosum]|nr:hypothetical protein BHE74_00003734 [Ensete ventricosum]